MAVKTFAQRAKTIMNKHKLRLGDKFDKNDPLALAAMNQELEALQQEQEAVRQVEVEKDQQFQNNAIEQFANGGKLTKRQRTSLSELLPQYHLGGGVAHNHGEVGTGGGFDFGGVGTTETFDPTIGGGEGGYTTAPTVAGDVGGGDNIGDPFKSRVPWMGAAAGAIGGLLANRKIDLPSYEYEEYKPEKARANLVDLSRGREQTMRERDQAQAMITRGARGTGSQAGLMENILAGATGTQRAAGTAFNRSLEQEANINAQIKNQASQFNAAQAAQAAQINTRNKLYANQLERENVLIGDQRRQSRIGAVTGAIQGYTKDRLAADQYDQMINMMAPENYKLTQSKDNLFRRLFQISPEMDISFLNSGDKASNKQ